jgi:hypothetical protein
VEQLARVLSSVAGLGPRPENGPAATETAPAVPAGPSTLAIAPVVEPAPTALFIESDSDLVELPLAEEAEEAREAEDAFPVEEAPEASAASQQAPSSAGSQAQQRRGAPLTAGEDLEELEPVEE